MIEINLSPKEKNNQLNNLGGINFSLLNVKMIFFSIILLYGIEPFLLDYYVDEEAKITKINARIRKSQREISTQLTELKDVKKQVEDLNRQETDLAKKVTIVKKIVDKRQNPFKVFKYIAENTPPDVWINELQLELVGDQNNLKLVGYSKSWKSISDFLENIKDSVFFDPRGTNFVRTQGAVPKFGTQRVEPFTITAKITSFK